MQTNHLDVVKAIWNQQPAEKTVDGALAFTLRVIAALPPDEHAGLLQKTGGENIVAYAGTFVSAARICYPDGQLYKLLTNVPSNDAPEWLDDGTVEPSLWIPVLPFVPPPAPPPAGPTIADVLARLDSLESNVIAAGHADRDAVLARIDQVVKNAEASARAIEPIIVAAIPALAGLFTRKPAV